MEIINEKKICKYTGKKYCVTLNSGTDALMMSLWSLGIGKGDEVITSPVSFVATAGAIVHVGAKPVFVDVELSTFNLDLDIIEKKITKRTKAIKFGNAINPLRASDIFHTSPNVICVPKNTPKTHKALKGRMTEGPNRNSAQRSP